MLYNVLVFNPELFDQIISQITQIHKMCINEYSYVQGTSGIRHLDGARVGIVAKPSAEFVAGILGTWLCGGVAVPLALSYPEAELLHVMNDSVCPITHLFTYLAKCALCSNLFVH